MIKHIGKHNDRRVVIVYREVPDESHMCLLVYSDVLPRMIHDELMKCIEGVPAQASSEISELLFRTLMADGANILTTLHQNGWLKKVPTNQVIVTPTSNSTVRLDELNDIINQMAQGEESVRKLAELDRNAGMTGRSSVPRDVGEFQGALSDADLAKQRISQAESMKLQAEQLIIEAKRLEAEAKDLMGKNVSTAKKTASNKKQAA